jgi:hypothetical protein
MLALVPPRGWNLRSGSLFRDVVRGPAHPAWRGDAASADSKRKRARRLYPTLGRCDGCDRPAIDRHHRDGDPGNNARANVVHTCRRCHMTADGRLVAFRTRPRVPAPPKPCVTCRRLSKPLRNWRCHACDVYWRRYGVERPYRDDGRRERLGRWHAPGQLRLFDAGDQGGLFDASQSAL